MVNYFEPQRDEGTFFLRTVVEIAKLRIFLSRILQKHRGRSEILSVVAARRRTREIIVVCLADACSAIITRFHCIYFRVYRAIAFAIANLLESAKWKKITRGRAGGGKRGGLIAPSLLTDGGYGLKHRFKTLIFRHRALLSMLTSRV